MLLHVITREWILPKDLEYICGFLSDTFHSIDIMKELKKEAETLWLYWKALGVYLIRLCNMFQQKDAVSEDTIVKICDEWCTRSFDLLGYDSGSHDESPIIEEIFQTWSTAVKNFFHLARPISVVKQWVKMECIRKHEDLKNDARILFRLLLSQKEEKIPKWTAHMVAEKELAAYEEMTALYPEFCQQMQIKITNILREEVYLREDSLLKKSKKLLQMGKAFRIGNCTKECIQCLSDAISSLELNRKLHHKPFEHDSAVAYCLRAICTQEVEPDSQNIHKDIRAAICLWMGIFTTDGCPPTVPEDIMPLLYNVMDLSSIKGYMDIQNEVHRLIIILFKRMASVEKCIAKLWESRRIGHALCSSPLNESFIEALSTDQESPWSIRLWKSCFEESDPSLFGFELSLGSLRWENPEGSLESDGTVEKVEKTVKQLTSNDPMSVQSAYIVGHLYYDLGDILVSNGRLIEALLYANQALLSRHKLLQKKLWWSGLGKNESYDDTCGMHLKSAASIKDLKMAKEVVSELWEFNSFDLDCCYLSPWNAVQCYLESILQVGLIHDIVGNGSSAEICFKSGKSLSESQCLPQFSVTFSTALGKVYHKKHVWDLAEKELLSAKRSFEDSSTRISCTKCRCMLEATIHQNLGDLCQKFYDHACSRSLENFSVAEKWYRSATKKLMQWKSSMPGKTSPEETSMSTFHRSEGHLKDLSKPTKDGLADEMEAKKYKKTENECEFLLELKRCAVDIGNGMTCMCNRELCWQCLPPKIIKSGSLKELVHLKWEFVRSRLLLGILTGLGNCLENLNRISDAHDVLSESISALVGLEPFSASHPPHILHGLMAREIPGDVFSVERAQILFNASWLFLKRLADANASSHVPLPKLVSWLMLSFVLCRDVPVLSQNVSILLATIFLVSASSSSELFSLPSFSSTLHERHWASYFHQASIGTHLNCQLVTNRSQASNDTRSTFVGSEEEKSIRLAPESIQELEKFVACFFKNLPSTTIICISVLGDPYTGILQLLSISHGSHARVLISRLHLDCEPLVLLLPVKERVSERKDDKKHWLFPWGSSVVDKLAPEFRSIMDEYFLLNSVTSDTEESKKLREKGRKDLSCRLSLLLKELEDTWFGPWRHVLQGEWKSKELDNLYQKLVSKLVAIDKSVLKVILGGSKRYFYGAYPSDAWFEKGCYIDKVGNYDSNISDGIKESEVFKQIHGAHNAKELPSGNRKPIILVLDSEVQMLPWENMRILRREEIYRMPSVRSISVTLKKNLCSTTDKNPSRDPSNAFYLLNPDGDLSHTQSLFEDLFRKHNLTGGAGFAPEVGKLAELLKSHDLFIYIGHGSGAQHIPLSEIEGLKKCPAALLMGCSSGFLKLNGSYVPEGVALSYLLAGSPFVVANLWNILSGDIDRFTRFLLEHWLERGQREKLETLGSLMSEARHACEDRFLTGGAVVWYGVPTVPRKIGEKDV